MERMNQECENPAPPTQPPPPPEIPLVYARPVRPLSPLEVLALPPPDARLDLALLLAIGLLIPLGTEIGSALVWFETPDFPPHAVLAVRKWFDALMLLILAAYFVYRHRVPSASFGLQGDHFVIQLLWSLPTLVAVYTAFGIMLALTVVVLTLYPPAQQDILQRTEFFELLPLSDMVAAVLLLIPVAIHEELLFRSLLIPLLRRSGCSWTAAIVLSSVVFGLLHIAQGWLGILQIFGVGLALAICFVLTRSATAVIVAHLLFNLIQFQLARLVLPWMHKLQETA